MVNFSVPAVSPLLDLVGSTPLVPVPAAMFGTKGTLLVKLEHTNPSGSSKDRTALAMVEAAEREGLLRPGSVIVEPTSGNTGAALAMISAIRGYRFVAVMPDKVSLEKRALLRAYGAEVVVCPTSAAPDSPDSYYSVASRLTAERDAFHPDQYHNPHNAEAHLVTGAEIWEATEGKVTHVVVSAGTCGTATGIARALARLGDVSVSLADPSTSVFSGGPGGPYLVEGVGEDFFPAAWDRNLYDAVIPVSDADAFSAGRTLARRCGLLLGGSTGMAFAALRHVAGVDDSSVVVVVSADGGRGYLSKFHDDDWMTRSGFSLDLFDPARVTSMPVTPSSVRLVHPDDVCPDLDSFAVVTTASHRVVRTAVIGVIPPFTRSNGPAVEHAGAWRDAGVSETPTAGPGPVLVWDQGVLVGIRPS